MTQCTQENIPIWDRFSVDFRDSTADQLSYYTQNAAGIFAISLSFLWHLVCYFRKRLIRVIQFLKSFLNDFTYLLIVTTCNGLCTEISHLLLQRPRPYVYHYNHPLFTLSPASYVSFYSGHTSFAASMATSMVVLMNHYQAPIVMHWLAATLGYTLCFATAYFRIIAGQHFFTDVLVGAIAGGSLAGLLKSQLNTQTLYLHKTSKKILKANAQ